MASWTPRDLTNPSFVATQLSAKDRSYALNSVTRELNSAEPRLAQQEAELAAADEAANNKPDRRVVRELLAKAKDQTLSQTERDASAAEAAKLQDEREKLISAAERALQRVLSTREYVSNLTLGQSNLLQAGAVPPGENMFAPPPGYEGRNAVAAQVPSSQNPNPAPATVTPLPDNSVPPPTGESTQDQANESNAAIRAEEQRQLETELGATQAEADFIRVEEQRQLETELGATQAEANFINAEAQRQAEQQAQADDAEAFGAGSLKYTPPNITADGDAALAAFQQAQADDAEAFGAGSLRYTPPAVSVANTGDEALAATQQAQADDAEMFGAARGISAPLFNTRSQASQQDSTNAAAQGDWRVRLSLAPNADYLYKAPKPGILEPLAETKGVLFPYTPAISVSYAANYSPQDLVHSNYKIYQYTSSSVDQISITCDFTAQDAKEARYMLAVIHFFRSVTKMFYGQDQNPKLGTPPPLCYLTGMGQFQFDRHPLVVTNFTMSLPTDVDYIRAANATNVGVNTGGEVPKGVISSTSADRLRSGSTPIGPGGTQTPAIFTQRPGGTVEATYVPTKMQMQISASPIVTRSDISNNFSLTEYATGELLRGSKNKGGAGIW